MLKCPVFIQLDPHPHFHDWNHLQLIFVIHVPFSHRGAGKSNAALSRLREFLCPFLCLQSNAQSGPECYHTPINAHTGQNTQSSVFPLWSAASFKSSCSFVTDLCAHTVASLEPVDPQPEALTSTGKTALCVVTREMSGVINIIGLCILKAINSNH